MADAEKDTEVPRTPPIDPQLEEEEKMGEEGPITLEYEPPNSPPTIITEKPPEDDVAEPHPLPTPTLAAPGATTPTATDFSSPQRSPFGQDGHHGGERTESRTPLPVRLRTDSNSTTATASTTQQKSSLVFVVTSLESIAASKEARKNKKLTESLQRALAAIKGDGDPAHQSPEVLFEPLQLASELQTVQVVTTALDCIGKLISYSYFSIPAESQTEPSDGPPLIERAIDTICDCFQSEATPVETQLQIVKSLLAAILNDKIVVHGAGLLKAVRLTYNIFLLSKSSPNQMLAQTALTQMVGTVFERVKTRLEMKEARLNASKTAFEKEDEAEESGELDTNITAVDGSALNEEADGSESSEVASTAPSDVPVEKRDAPKITLQSFENRKSFDDARITESAPTLVTRVKDRQGPKRMNSANGTPINGGPEGGADTSYEDEEDEIFIRDAYLVFRAMCRLSTKSLSVEHALDVKSQGMRSKLLSLHIIYSLLNNNTAVFISPYATIRSSNTDEPTSFVQAVKQYLCLSLSRNGASSVRPVFEVSCEIFWLMLKFLRVMLKKEIEVFAKEIYLAILDKRAAPAWQKQMILIILSRLAGDPRALVEVYLNYDCDRTALDNMFERITEHLSRISSTPVNVTAMQQQAFQESLARSTQSPASEWQHRIVLPSLSTASIQSPSDAEQGFPAEYAMKHEALEALVEILRSLVNWSQGNIAELQYNLSRTEFRKSADESRESIDKASTFASASPHIGATDSPGGFVTPVAEDDPSQTEREKQRKTAMANAVRQFNFKPKRGVKALIKDGFIKPDDPQDAARFFLGNDQINKATLGEYLGEGEPENIAIMHAFIDQMEFRQTRFVDALRRFLQSFRLPGEAQKIDRFMLKFAERYITGNPKAFANADTAYVLAYSAVMLNTDQHSSNVKKRMAPEDFIKNNRGINDNADLPEEYLRGIYEDIRKNEIVLISERETAANLGNLPQPSAGIAATIGQAVANASRDLKKEEYAQTEQIANRTEQLYKNLLRTQRRGGPKIQVAKFIPATSFKHAGPMFQVAWMSFLTALTGAAQNTHNLETVKLCMEGQKLAIRIACLFDLDDPRQAFVASLSRFTNLYNLSEMKAKNMEALKALLEVANIEGNLLRDSWRDILTCISQLDRFQLISTGVDEGAVPDVLKAHIQGRPQPQSRKSLSVPKGHRPRAQSGSVNFQADIAEESRSADIVRSVDRIFTNTAKMSGDGILHFVKALTQVSWQEIQSSGQSESPRTYSLQKIVEISGYNMTRVRFEWASIWQVLGQHFNQVGCHTNTHVVFFALDSLRQLSMRFLEIEELPGFKFQKDFLKPFEHIIGNSSVVPVKDMVLRCLIQMIQARGANIRSGWRTMFGVFTVAAREPYGE
jgi:brefeldin A-inhibited guanine nucleotide-exchange protein